MASTEKATQKAILELCQRPHIKLWRSNSGTTVLKSKGSRRVFRGAPRGTSDIIGWKCVYHTHGGNVAQFPIAHFVALEVKDEKWKSPPIPKATASKSTVSRFETYVAQAKFICDVRHAGGIAGFVRSIEDAFRLLGLG